MRRQCLIFAAAVLVVAGVAQAEDVWGGPPDGTWQRGDPNSTWQHWTFSLPLSGQIPIEPEEVFNPYGQPTAFLEGMFEWFEAWEGGPGGGPITGIHVEGEDGGTIALWIPNTPDPNFVKYIFMQITSSKAPSDFTVSGEGPHPYTSGTWNTGLPSIQHSGQPPFGGVWYTYNYGFTIFPNPEAEWIFIDFPHCTVIDQIVVDTICIPEPAVLSLLGVGALAMLRRRRI